MTEKSKELITGQAAPVSVYTGDFELAQRKAQALAASDLIPAQFKGNVPNCLIALEVAHRTGASILAVVQNLHVIHGRPSWSSQFIIAALNSCGRFAPLRFKVEVVGTDKTCVAWTTDKAGEILEGPAVSLSMAKAEGWSTKSGSKWATMPDLMLRYRAAAFFGRLYAPDVLLGMQSEDEVQDIASPEPVTVTEVKVAAKGLNEKIKAKKTEVVVAADPAPATEGEASKEFF